MDFVNDHSNPFHYQVNIVHTKPVNSNFSPKIGCHGKVPQHLCNPIQHMIPTAHPSPQSKRHPYRFSRLCTECPCTLQWDAQSPPKICPFPWGIWTPSNTWFLGPTQALNPNGSSIGSTVFAGLTSVTDRQTDRQTTLLGQ